MGIERGIGQIRPELVDTEARARYESYDALEHNDYLFTGQLSSGSLIQDLAAGATTNIVVGISGVSSSYYNVKPTYVTNGRATAQKFLNVSVTSPGTAVPIAQQRSDFTNNTSDITVTEDATIDTTDARPFPERLASTARGGQAGGAFVEAESVLLAPGDNLAIEINNISTSDIDTTAYLRLNPMPVEVVNTLTVGPTP